LEEVYAHLLEVHFPGRQQVDINQSVRHEWASNSTFHSVMH